MQKRKIIISAFLGVVSSLTLHPITSRSPANATTRIKNSFKYQGIVQENMAQLLGVEAKQIKLTKAERATWQDCLPTSGSQAQTCKAVPRFGWRVIMSGKSENWVYYVTDNGFITLDARASLNKTIRSTLAKELAIQTNQLQLTAVQLIRTTASCPRNTTACKPQPSVEWRILASGREKPFQLQLNGKPLNLPNSLKGFVPQDTAKMPRELAIQVLQDVISRDGIITANLRVESIKATTWNWCRGKGPGPTPPDMGACLDADKSGWQMIVVSGSNRYFYYISQENSTNAIRSYMVVDSPDGMQSLPKSAIETVQKDAAKRAKVSPNMISIKFAQPTFFDGCLNFDKQKISCGNSIQAGWQVTAIGGKPPVNSPRVSDAAWVYNVNLTGNNARFIQSSSWLPRP
ncbi:hypothetical protein NIES2101_10750 [Calothrix sp. HK-06]|nr:hypothetical protein NIES2101_10750 [Calothrix sp. HK-06]